MASGVSNLKVARSPLLDASSELSGFLRQARSSALASTTAYVVSPQSAVRITAGYAVNCESETIIPDPRFQLQLPNQVILSDTEWSICFNSRGLANDSLFITLADNKGQSSVVEVFLGGAVRVQ